MAVSMNVQLRSVVLKEHQRHLEGGLSHKALRLTPRACNSGGLRWGLTICIFNKFPGEVHAAGVGPHSDDTLPFKFVKGGRAAAHTLPGPPHSSLSALHDAPS